MSTGLNSMTGVILVDFIRPLYKKPISEAKASFYMKIMVVVLGCIFVALAFAVDQLGGLIQVNKELFFMSNYDHNLGFWGFLFLDIWKSCRYHCWYTSRDFHFRNVMPLG